MCCIEILKEEKVIEKKEEHEIQDRDVQFLNQILDEIDKNEVENSIEKSESESISASEEKDEIQFTVQHKNESDSLFKSQQKRLQFSKRSITQQVKLNNSKISLNSLKIGQYLKKESGLTSKQHKNNDYIILDNQLFDSMSSMAMQFRTIPLKNEKNTQANTSNLMSLTSFQKNKKVDKQASVNIVDIMRISKRFFLEIPAHLTARRSLPQPIFENHARNSCSQVCSDDNIFKDCDSSIDMDFEMEKLLYFCQLQNKYQDILDQKIYEPYFISNNTIMTFENKKGFQKFSFSEIVSRFVQENVVLSKLFFKVQSGYSLKTHQHKSQSQMQNDIVDENTMSPFYTNEKENYWKNKMNEMEEVEYFEFEMKKLSNSEEQTISKHSNDFQVVKNDDEQIGPINASILVNIKNISQIIKSQQKISDQMYLDATEQNYSHEQMTPLNSILANSKIIYRRYMDLIKFQETELQKTINGEELEKLKRKNEESLKILKAIQQSGQIMWFYNQNQIQRMKIKKNEFVKKFSVQKNLVEQIERVINPFEPQISSRNLKVFIVKKRDFNFIIKFDWTMYQLSLFNMIQNAVKYNQFLGNILIVLDCRPIQQLQSDQNEPKMMLNDQIETHIFETEVIDSGIGISEERQKMLFIPFMELKMKQNLTQVNDHNIGMGLGCSQQIVASLGGDITVKQSQRGLTIFAFKVPVFVQENKQVEIDDKINQSNMSLDQIAVQNVSNFQNGFQSDLQNQIKNYLNNQQICDKLIKLKFAEIELPPEKNQALIQQMNRRVQRSGSIQLQSNNSFVNKLKQGQEFSLFNQNCLQIDKSRISNISNQPQLQNSDMQKENFSNKQNLSINNDQSFQINQSSSIQQENKNQQKQFAQMNRLKNQNELPSSQSFAFFRQDSRLKQKKFLGNESSSRSIDNIFINQESESVDNISMQDNQNILDIEEEIKNEEQELSQLQRDICNENQQIQSNQNMNKNLQILNNNDQDIISESQLGIVQRLTLQGCLNKKISRKFLSVPRNRSFISEIQNKEISLQNQNKKNILMRPKNPFLNKKNEQQLLNKNLNKDLNMDQKIKVCINILQNNHKDKLVDQVMKNQQNIQENRQDEEFILKLSNKSENSENIQELDESQVSGESLVFDLMVGDSKNQIYQKNESQSMSSQFEKQIEKMKNSHYKNNKKQIDFLENHQKMQIDKQGSVLQFKSENKKLPEFEKSKNSNELQKGQSIYFEDDESESSIVFLPINNSNENNLIKQDENQQNILQRESECNQIKNKKKLKKQQFLSKIVEEIEHEEQKLNFQSPLEQNQIQARNRIPGIKRNSENDEESKSDKSDQLNSQQQVLGENEQQNIQNYNLFKQINQSQNAYNIFVQIPPSQEQPEIINNEERKSQGNSINIIKNQQENHVQILKSYSNNISESKRCNCQARILVVDDIEFNILPLKLLIKEHFDIEIEEATNGAIAVEMYKKGLDKPCKCSQRSYTLIFMDLQMPVMGGLQATQKIQQLIKDANGDDQIIQEQKDSKQITSIVVLSAFQDEKTKQECFLAGAKDFINKPIQFVKLHKIMHLYYYATDKKDYIDIYKEQFLKSYQSSKSIMMK